ncbi:MAG: hypothetical protein AAFV53_16785 [Myxococcota bacterium]
MLHLLTGDQDVTTLSDWDGLPGQLKWTEQRLMVSPDFPAELIAPLSRLIELLISAEGEIRAQGRELAAALPRAAAELAHAAAVAHRVHRLSEQERTFLPRIWRLSPRNVERLRQLSVSLGADDITFVDDDDCIECDVFYLGI